MIAAACAEAPGNMNPWILATILTALLWAGIAFRVLAILA